MKVVLLGPGKARPITRQTNRENGAMNFNQVMTIYRNAVDQTATTAESSDWWREVQAEIEAVITAPTKTAAGAIIAWWKSE